MRPPIPPLLPPGAEFALGESPFRAKGMLYIGTQTFFTEHLRGGLEELASDIREPELREFITQRFLPSGWYDVMPVPALIAYEARALRMSLEDYLRHRTRWQAQRDIHTVHRWVLRLASPAMVATRLPRLMSQMFDFVDVQAERAAESEVLAHMAGVPLVLNEWYVNALGVYADATLRLAGARTVDASFAASQAAERRAGVELNRLSIRIQWT